MSTIPPPVPPECTMEGNEWFPFYFDRVRKSKWWRRASDTARSRSVMMWGEAYKAVPAGSLPDDDDELAEAAGYGMDVEAFLAVKDEILSAWTLCSDGRWYHPTICEVVLDAWERMGERRRKEAAKKRDQRARARGVPPAAQNVPRDAANVPGDIPEKPRDIDTQTEQTRQTGQDTHGSSDELPLDAGKPAKPKADRRKPEIAIPEGFPDQRAILEAQTKLRAEGVDLDARVQAERFRNHAHQIDRRCRDWTAAWRNWISKAIDGAPKRAPAAPVAELDPKAVWRMRIGKFVESRFWLEPWGVQPRREAPQRDGVQVPDEILAEFGFPTRTSRSAA